MITIFTALAILLAYTITLCAANKEIPRSLSDTVFSLPVGGSWLWTLVIGSIAILAMPAFIERCSVGTQFLAFISCAGLALVAAAPLVRNKSDIAYSVHMGGAYACGVCSQIAISINNLEVMLLWMAWVFAFIWITKDKLWQTQVFWAEMTCFSTTFAFCVL